MSCNARKEEKRINLKDLFAFKDSSYVTFWKEVMKISATNVTWCARQNNLGFARLFFYYFSIINAYYGNRNICVH